MQSNLNNLTPVLSEDYSELLEKHGLSYTNSNYYLEVGIADWTQGWIIDLSAMHTQFEVLIETILPLLIRERLVFKIAKNAKNARALLGGEYGYLLLGKFVTIYPPDETSAVKLAKELIELTRSFKGPNILTDRQLQGVLFTRYGAVRPIIQINDRGMEEICIHGPNGSLIKDPYNIPFQLPEGISWPFNSIAPPLASKVETVLQDKYKPIALLKEDTKGFVKKGLYLEKWWWIKWCVIKEGKMNMLGDSFGRDMTDRLRWQYELHKDLESIVPLPRIYDFFEENGNSYLVMEYIKGRPLQETALDIIKDHMWADLPFTERLQLLNYILQVLDIIARMHEKDYIHRDITPANFLVDKDRRLRMIDLELSYSTSLKKPYPPFRLGTPGYMSPEQWDTRTPRTEQDIYAIGALCLLLFTGLPAIKYNLEDQTILNDQLSFLIPDRTMVMLLCSCLSKTPDERPTIPEIRNAVSIFQENQTIISAPANKMQVSIQKAQLENVIRKALRGLVSPTLINADKLWISRIGGQDESSYSQDSSVEIFPGLALGLSGVLYLLAKTLQLGFAIDECMESCENSLNFIASKSSEQLAQMPAGLYGGTAGIALALAEGVYSGLITEENRIFEIIKSCFQNENITGPGMVKGWAGRGLALLKSKCILPEELVRPLLTQTVDQLLFLQQKDGSWMVESSHKKTLRKPTGFGHGTAGVLCFLLAYLEVDKDNTLVSHAVLRGLEWLVKQAAEKNNKVRWPLHAGSTTANNTFQDGSAGIALCLLKGYQVTGTPIYKELAENCLRHYPSRLVSADCTLSSGLVGWGEVYLEAALILKSEEWQQRADWITAFLLHHFCQDKEDSCYWMPAGSPFTTAGLLEGNSGIIHFLMRSLQPQSLNHPLLAM